MITPQPTPIEVLVRNRDAKRADQLRPAWPGQWGPNDVRDVPSLPRLLWRAATRSAWSRWEQR